MEGGLELVAEACVDGEVGVDAPVVLKEDIVGGGAEVGIGAAEADGAGLGEAEEEVGEVESGGGEGQAALIERAGGQAGEGEGAAGVLVGAVIELEAAVLATDGGRVIAVDADEAVGEAGGLIAAEQRAGVGEAAEVGEVEVRGAVVDGVGGGSADAELASPVAAEGEEGDGLAAVSSRKPYNWALVFWRRWRLKPPERRSLRARERPARRPRLSVFWPTEVMNW
jgi:hypothetical protein